ncbi:FG-GAP repeat domain-containing protein [Micromonospora mangrovi]|uniref:FG-GAP repeat domain-containing protein n=1 Tax=Micromonospora mangrovi TaxID=1182597 RepID=A0ABV8MEU6_9ACTN
MTSFRRALLPVLAAVVTLSAVLVLPHAASAAVVPDCTTAAPTSGDATFAAQVNPTLTGKLAGYFTASRAACVRVIVQTVKSRGLPVRAATIAITTAIVETGIQNLNYGDQDSLGLYQQRPSQGWGTASEILDPVHSTNSFLSAMLSKYPNNSWMTADIGVVCQTVQNSAYPTRYGDEAADGARIAEAAWAGRVVGDFDADGSSDLALYRPDPVNGSVWDVRSWTAKADLWNDHRWGGANDIPLTGDFDGDGTADMALYRRDCTNGSTWWIKSGATGTQIEGGLRWGGCKDIPTTGDVNGDGYTDLVLYRQDCTNGSVWNMYNVRAGGTIRTDLRFGGCKDIPTTGDVNGDGYSDLVLYRQDCTNGSVWNMYNVRLGGTIRTDLRFGGCNDIPTTGDVNGDGYSDLVLYRQDCTNGSTWQMYNVRLSGSIVSSYRYGGCHDIPVSNNSVYTTA